MNTMTSRFCEHGPEKYLSVGPDIFWCQPCGRHYVNGTDPEYSPISTSGDNGGEQDEGWIIAVGDGGDSKIVYKPVDGPINLDQVVDRVEKKAGKGKSKKSSKPKKKASKPKKSGKGKSKKAYNKRVTPITGGPAPTKPEDERQTTPSGCPKPCIACIYRQSKSGKYCKLHSADLWKARKAKSKGGKGCLYVQ